MEEQVSLDVSATPIEDVAPDNELQTASEAAQEAAETPEPQPQKFWGHFGSEDEAKSALEYAFAKLGQYEKDQGYQQYLAQQQSLAADQERQRLAIQSEDEELLKNYANSVREGKPAEALLILKRGIEAKASERAAEIAQNVINQKLEGMAAPHRSKQQLLDNTQWKDLHPIADHTVWLAEQLGRLGYDKPTVAQFMRSAAKAYAETNLKKTRAGSWEEPTNSWTQLDGKDFDKATDAYWNKQLGLK